MPQLVASNLVTAAYKLALVLTLEAESAESIVAAAIDAVPNHEFCESTLLAEVARLAWAKSGIIVHSPEPVSKGEIGVLYPKLQDVLDLPVRLRYCFSLRVLAGLNAYTCGPLLGLQPAQVDSLARRSMQMLAGAEQIQDSLMLAAAC